MNHHSGIELLERALELLRHKGLQGVSIYAIGALPMACALLFYFADMAYNSRSNTHLAEYSLVLTLLFLWKNIWQAVFSNSLYDSLTGDVRSWTRPRILRMILVTTAVQPLALILLPIAIVATLPYPQVLGFFKNLQLFSAGEVPNPVGLSWRLSLYGAKQNYIALGVISLASLLTFLNCGFLLLTLPQLAKTFLGVESDLARMGPGVASPVLLVAVCLIVYLVFDPLLDAFYAIRCFHSETAETAEDLRIDFRRAAGIGLILMLTVTAMHAQQQPSPSVNKIDKAIEKVLERDEFLWRAPKEGDNPAWLTSLNRMWTRATDWFGKLLKKMFDKDKDQSLPPLAGGADRSTLETMLFIAAAVFLVALGAIFYWQRSQTQAPVTGVATTLHAVAVDLKDETVTADQLPEEEWLALANAEADKGEFRLATRALYLAVLNHLMHRNLVSIKKWKSGLEYLRELERRARQSPQVPQLFGQYLLLFEQGWYGTHRVGSETYQLLRSQIEELRRSANA